MRTAKAFTLPELMMALAIMAVTGLAVAGVSMALSDAYAHSQDFNDSIQTARYTLSQVQASVHKAKLITAVSTQSFVLWGNDANADGTINLDELQVYTYDPAAKTVTLRQVIFPATMAAATKAALNASITLAAANDMTGITRQVSQSPYVDTRVLANNVGSFKATASPAAPSSTMLSVCFAVGTAADRQLTLRSSAGMRADVTSLVTKDKNGLPVLTVAAN
jgi:prepilin-type N-terminal cleavage/methylation domain-containing protein